MERYIYVRRYIYILSEGQREGGGKEAERMVQGNRVDVTCGTSGVAESEWGRDEGLGAGAG